jgi:hypothetical protein
MVADSADVKDEVVQGMVEVLTCGGLYGLAPRGSGTRRPSEAMRQ